MKFSSIALIAAVAGVADAFAPASQSAASSSALSMSLEKYSDELKATAAAMVQEGKGLLACDESTGTVGARLESIGLENNEDNRREVSILLIVVAGDVSIAEDILIDVPQFSFANTLVPTFFPVASTSFHHPKHR